MRIEEGFQQKAPQLELSWSGPGQRSFRALVQRLLAGTDYFDQVDADMREFEKRIAGRESPIRVLWARPTHFMSFICSCSRRSFTHGGTKDRVVRSVWSKSRHFAHFGR